MIGVNVFLLPKFCWELFKIITVLNIFLEATNLSCVFEDIYCALKFWLSFGTILPHEALIFGPLLTSDYTEADFHVDIL